MTLRLLTANLGGDRTAPETVSELLERFRPDVAALQELTVPTARAVAEALPHHLLRPVPEAGGIGIALRRPAALEPLFLPYRPALSARLEPEHWPGLSDPVEVISVHLMGPHAWPPWWAWPIRLGQVRALTTHLEDRSRLPLALAGDLNATPRWPAYRRLTARLTDEPLRLAGGRPPPTWGPRFGWPRLLRIDHLLVRGLEATRVEVVPVSRSDHAALVADLR